MTAPLLLGTASWTDRPLIGSGRFYPPGANSAEARLRHYAARFPLVEADAPYYGLPTAGQSRRWIERTPEGFTFDVKAYSLFTEHPTPVARLPKAIQALLPNALAAKGRFYRRDAPDEIVDLCWAAYADALLPLHDAGRLGAVLLQFPKWFVPGRRAFAYLEEARERLGPFRGAVEFRHRGWLEPARREETLALLGDLGLSFVCVDGPRGFDSSLPPIAAATSALALVRFHGRNRATWERRARTSSERFDYWYRAAELDEWTPRIAALADEAEAVHLIVNTNNHDQGPANAELLRARLAAAGLDAAPGFGSAAAPPPPPPAAGADAPRGSGAQGALL